MSPPIPSTLLTLRLSSPSFLETILTVDGRPVYSTETNGNTTTLSRCDPYRGLSLVANIHWPDRVSPKGKGKDSFFPAQVFMDGSFKSEDDLLKRNCLNTSRKFRIPGHSHQLKWRRVQGIFQCTSSSGAPIALFEPSIITARARLHVYTSTLTGLGEVQGGVSPLLLDYLIVTALLLLTHPEDWHGLSSPSSPHASLPFLHIPHTYTSTASTSPVSSVSSDFSCAASSSPDRTSSESADTETVLDISPEFKEDYEPPPPYEEIQWTVRVRQPRSNRVL